MSSKKSCSDASKLLNKIDVYGSRINMNFDGQNSKITTSCGGLMTILLVASTIGYFALNIISMYRHEKT